MPIVIVSRSGPGGCPLGGTGFLPQAGLLFGVQAPCCLSTTFIVCPGDKLSCEFRMRPTLAPAKGTGAQHRQALKPCPLRPVLQRRLPALKSPTKQPPAQHQPQTNQPQKNPSPALSQTRVFQSKAITLKPNHQPQNDQKDLTVPRKNAAPTRTYSRPGTQSW